MNLSDKFANRVMDFRRYNYGNYPDYILINPKTLISLVEELTKYTSLNFDIHNAKFMGIKLVKSEDIESDVSLYDSIIPVATKFK